MKQFSEDFVFELIKQSAENLKENNINGFGIRKNFFDDFPYINFENLKERAKENNFFIEKASNITSEDELFKELTESNSLIIFLHENIHDITP